MTITDTLLFMHIPKTAGVFVGKLLKHFSKSYRGYGHVAMRDLPLEYLDRYIVAAIRNPWAYYVSSFAYLARRERFDTGVMTPAEFVTSKAGIEFFRDNMREVLTPAQDTALTPINWRYFDNALDQETLKPTRRRATSDAIITAYKTVLPELQIRRKLNMGKLTYHYLSCCFRDSVKIFKSGKVPTTLEHNELITVDRVVKVERLRDEMSILLDIPRQEIDDFTAKLGPAARNKSKHLPYQDYYTPELRDAVAHKDRLIIDKYGYSF